MLILVRTGYGNEHSGFGAGLREVDLILITRLMRGCQVWLRGLSECTLLSLLDYRRLDLDMRFELDRI